MILAPKKEPECTLILAHFLIKLFGNTAALNVSFLFEITISGDWE
jgi:hypothetical protein